MQTTSSIASPLEGVVTALIDVRDVSKAFGATRALTGVSLQVREGRSHGLLGRNGAGKSTLVSVMTGLVKPDEGSVLLDGQDAPKVGERARWLEKVACVYQRSRLVPSLSVAENLFLNTAKRSAIGTVNWSAIRRDARCLLAEWGLEDINPSVEVDMLTIAQKRLVELARALSFGCRFVILDEPTAGLDGQEVHGLVAKINALQEKGVTFLYISHHLNETFEICQDATVLRDGRLVLSSEVQSLRQADIVSAMVGSAVAVDRPARATTIREAGSPVLDVNGLSYLNLVEKVDLQIRAGEIIGLAGLAGSGKAQVAGCIAGLLRSRAGTITINGVALKPGDVRGTIDCGVGYVGSDRHHDGFVVDDSIRKNASLSILKRSARVGLLNRSRENAYAETMIRRLSIKASSKEQPVAALSGGNQQKVVFARALASNPKLLLLVNPLAGVDVASNEILYGAVEKAAEDGCAVLIVSDDLDELAPCDSIEVMFKGRLTKRFGKDRTSHELIAAIEGLEA